VQPKLEIIPDGDWYCYECISKVLPTYVVSVYMTFWSYFLNVCVITSSGSHMVSYELIRCVCMAD